MFFYECIRLTLTYIIHSFNTMKSTHIRVSLNPDSNLTLNLILVQICLHNNSTFPNNVPKVGTPRTHTHTVPRHINEASNPPHSPSYSGLITFMATGLTALHTCKNNDNFVACSCVRPPPVHDNTDRTSAPKMAAPTCSNSGQMDALSA